MYDLFKHKPYDEATIRRIKCYTCYSSDIIVTVERDGVVLRDGEKVLGGLNL